MKWKVASVVLRTGCKSWTSSGYDGCLYVRGRPDGNFLESVEHFLPPDPEGRRSVMTAAMTSVQSWIQSHPRRGFTLQYRYSSANPKLPNCFDLTLSFFPERPSQFNNVPTSYFKYLDTLYPTSGNS
ncbi:hypothetical protein J6590_031668 [Homalodisca vitripennis]|nr:hypothetical protein J6590_031668 [Homalodisca vitripennis]